MLEKKKNKFYGKLNIESTHSKVICVMHADLIMLTMIKRFISLQKEK